MEGKLKGMERKLKGMERKLKGHMPRIWANVYTIPELCSPTRSLSELLHS